MIYEYTCDECLETHDVELDLEGLQPKAMNCLTEGCNGKMRRVWSTNTIIPEHMKSSAGPSINYEKRNTIHKKNFGSAGNY